PRHGVLPSRSGHGEHPLPREDAMRRGCKLDRRLVVAAHRCLELALAHLGAALDAEALRLAIELFLRLIATTDRHLMPPFVRGYLAPNRRDRFPNRIMGTSVRRRPGAALVCAAAEVTQSSRERFTPCRRGCRVHGERRQSSRPINKLEVQPATTLTTPA